MSIKTRWVSLAVMLNHLAASTWFAYATIILLQFKVVNGMWLYHDLPIGDTAWYYLNGVEWFSQFQGNIAWSPLYTLYFGFLHNFFTDPFTIAIIHRLILVFVITVLLLVVLRRMLPAHIAWLMAAWWTVTSVTFDTTYEVHLFAVFPTLIGLWLATSKPSAWMRGAVFAVLLVSTVLIRNEIAIALGLWILICLIWEVRRFRDQPEKRAQVGHYLRAYGIPTLIAVSVIVFFYIRSSVHFPELSEGLSRKHTLNVCQIYAFNYQQRYTDWTLSPWTECQDLMRRDFGVDEPSMMEAIRLNPGAMLDYFRWNVRLIPDGLQVLLFGATGGYGQPDYIMQITGSTVSTLLSLIVLVVIVSGIILFLRHRHYWWEKWFKERMWGWLFLFCIVCVMFVVILMQRPRPSYLYPLFVFILVLIGSCLYIISDRVRLLKHLLLLQPVFAILLIILLPSHYNPEYIAPHTGTGQVFNTGISRLRVFRGEMEQISPSHQFVARGFGQNLFYCMYIIGRECATQEFDTIISGKPAEQPLGEWLVEQNVGLLYINEWLISEPEIQTFLENIEDSNWHVLGEVHGDGVNWMFLKNTGL